MGGVGVGAWAWACGRGRVGVGQVWPLAVEEVMHQARELMDRNRVIEL